MKGLLKYCGWLVIVMLALYYICHFLDPEFTISGLKDYQRAAFLGISIGTALIIHLFVEMEGDNER